MEIWKDVKGYEGLYQVSNYGRIKSLDRYIPYKGRKEKQRLIAGKIKEATKVYNKNYLKVSLFKNGKGKTREVQRIVAEAFIPNPLNKKQVNHIDGNGMNNHISNLEWVTPRENSIHKVVVLGRGIKEVCQYDLNGKLVGRYRSLKEAEIQTGVKRCSISNVVCGRRKTAGQYKWKLSV